MTITPSVADFLTPATDTTVHPAATEDEAALLAWAIAHPTPRPPAERDGNGRYKLPDPETGEPATWTRATGYASALDDSEGLTVWRNRLLVKGLAQSPEVLKRAQGADGRTLSGIAATALHVGGYKLAADIGTALHTATEHYDLLTDERPPEPWDGHVREWGLLLYGHGIECPEDMVERICLTAELGCAGTIDRIATIGTDRYILDLKTGKSYDRPSYAIQLAIYAHATHLRSIDGTGWEPMPPVDQETALIVHLPASGGPAALIEVDIAAGWEMAKLCGLVREARKAKGIFAVRPSRSDWIVGRLKAIAASNEVKAKQAVRQFWPADTPTKPPWTAEHVDAIDAVLRQVEVVDDVPFPATDPTMPSASEALAAELAAKADRLAADAASKLTARPIDDDGTPATEADAADLKASVAAFRPEQLEQLRQWCDQGHRAGRRWAFSLSATKRVAAVNAAAIACIAQFGDDLDVATRRAMEIVLGDDLQPAWSTGACLGSLTHTEATRLESIACRFGAGDPEVVATIGDCLATHWANQARLTNTGAKQQ